MNDGTPPGNKRRTKFANAMRASALGITLVVSTAIGLLIGLGLDSLLKTKPYLTIIFFILGVCSGFWQLLREVKRSDENDTGDHQNGGR